ncbi:calcium-dependent phosphotriesterase [Coprinellus micaceus]|uniref:Calcium-dependent phosphotriesterase n=1 Tax=Coprinellus micaceus TaxID=71717 RepID=A0A4Y7STA8_COPMI|nr:calcium-dependent phosphotriesterase [Coprinellus micaceus]
MIAGPLVDCGLEKNNFVNKISMKDVEAALQSAESPVHVPVEQLELSEDVQMTDGGTGPFHGSLLLITSGRGTQPSSVVAVNPQPPYNTTVLWNNYYGRQFNSLNDAKIHPSGKIFVTDAPSGLNSWLTRIFVLHVKRYGAQLGFRPPATLPNQVYRFDPVTNAVRVVAGDFDICNGIAFTTDGSTAYVSSSRTLGQTPALRLAQQDLPQSHPLIRMTPTRYAFDVDPVTHAFKNRRIFAYADIGIPDGLIVDTRGNVYTGAGDGVHVWNSIGTLLGKFFIGMVSANMAFAGDGRLVILAETKVFCSEDCGEVIFAGVSLIAQSTASWCLYYGQKEGSLDSAGRATCSVGGKADLVWDGCNWEGGRELAAGKDQKKASTFYVKLLAKLFVVYLPGLTLPHAQVICRGWNGSNGAIGLPCFLRIKNPWPSSNAGVGDSNGCKP